MCVLQNFALFASRLRKSSFISRQHLINNSKPITSLSSSSILWSLSSLTTTTTTKQWGEVMRGTFTVFFFTFCDFWCDNDEKSPQASTSFQACVRIHLSPTVPDNTSFVETVWSDSFLINIYVPLYVFLSNVFFLYLWQRGVSLCIGWHWAAPGVLPTVPIVPRSRRNTQWCLHNLRCFIPYPPLRTYWNQSLCSYIFWGLGWGCLNLVWM